MKRLIKKFDTVSPESLEDHLMIMASNVESSMIQAGANEGDYTILDLYKLSQPFALEVWKQSDKMTYST